MGDHQIQTDSNNESLRVFMRALLEDVHALEAMLDRGMIESDMRRIGAEQEMFLVDASRRPVNRATEVLSRLGEGPFTPELGLFNLEVNLSPQVLGGDCLSRMENELIGLMKRVDSACAAENVEVALCGILPTLEKLHLELDSMTPSPRFHSLNRIMRDLRGGEFRTLIKGLDELQLSHDNVMLEACNTSFQVHFQVAPNEFAKLYNVAQAVTGPVLAAAVNSPVLLRHRLWHETRVALFQQSLDARSDTHQARGGHQRVSFGNNWVDSSVLEIFREDISRFRVLIASDLDEAPMELVDKGLAPTLKALCLHNGTVYRWNRPCYGVKDGIPHLRIENRVLPAGPTIVDEIANAAFFFGLMCAVSEEFEDVSRVMPFQCAKENFINAARYGLKARMSWMRGKTCPADELILNELLPLAREGLICKGVDSGDVERYLGVLEGRVRSGRTGAQWVFDSLDAMGNEGRPAERFRSLVSAQIEGARAEKPVHTWELAELNGDDSRHSYQTVGQIMTTDLFTVHEEDLVDLAASLMDWEHVRYVPVEDNNGCLRGLVTHRQMLRMVGHSQKDKSIAVREIMQLDPVTVGPETSTLEAIAIMRKNELGCLPVMKGNKLVGIVTESDFIDVAAKLLEQWLKAD